MTDVEFTSLSEQDRIRVLSTACYITLSEELSAMLFLVDDFFVEVFYNIYGNVLTTITYSSATLLPECYLDQIALTDLQNR